MRALLVVGAFGGLALAGCWTGSSAPAPRPTNVAPAETPQPPLRFRITLERTQCLGTCPAYKVTIHGDGRVDWEGIEFVAAKGRLDGKRMVSRVAVEHLSRMLDEAKFFDRNQSGELEQSPQCTTTAGTTTCSFSMHLCTDTPHAILTVTRAGRTHEIDNDHCDEKPGIDEIEAEIDRMAGTAELIGR